MLKLFIRRNMLSSSPACEQTLQVYRFPNKTQDSRRRRKRVDYVRSSLPSIKTYKNVVFSKSNSTKVRKQTSDNLYRLLAPKSDVNLGASKLTNLNL